MSQAVRTEAYTRAASQGGGVLEAAKARLLAQKTPQNQAALQKLSAGNNFSDEVVLALRLLPDARLQELAGRLGSLRQQLARSPDRNQCMMSMIWAIDPEVQDMVGKLKQLDDGQAGGAAGSPQASST